MIQAHELVSAEALRRYDDSGDPVYTTYERVLLTLRWFDWCSAERLCEALGLDLDEPRVWPERHLYALALAYWVKRGRVEKRYDRTVVEYRLLAPSRWVTQTVCTRCPLAVVPGKTMCQQHLDYERDYKRRRRAA